MSFLERTTDFEQPNDAGMHKSEKEPIESVLSTNIKPENYKLVFDVNFENFTFDGLLLSKIFIHINFFMSFSCQRWSKYFSKSY